MPPIADPPQKHRRRSSECSTRYTPAEIPKLSIDEIRALSREALIALIEAADIPLLQGETEHLRYSDRETLERLAFLAQRTVRNRSCETFCSRKSFRIQEERHVGADTEVGRTDSDW